MIESLLVEASLPAGTPLLNLCSVQMCLQESLYFPMSDGYTDVIKLFQFVLNGGKWSIDPENVREFDAIGLWGRTSTHRLATGYRCLLLLQKEKTHYGEGATG